MRKLIFILILTLIFGCKTNQTINKVRKGYWIETYKIGESEYKSTGTYSNGNPIRKWKYYKNDTLYQKEKYHKNICKTIYYHKNGKVMQRGQSMIEIKNGQLHWFYFGNWYFYDANKKLIKLKNYENGKLMIETDF